jgi:hypothetical protein
MPAADSGPITTWPITTMVVAGIAVVIGSSLPWILSSTLIANGRLPDATLTFVGGAVAVTLALFYVGRPVRLWIFGSGFLFAAITSLGIYDMIQLRTISGDQAFGSVSIGPGLWLCVVSAVMGLGAAVWFTLRNWQPGGLFEPLDETKRRRPYSRGGRNGGSGQRKPSRRFWEPGLTLNRPIEADRRSYSRKRSSDGSRHP